MKEGSAGFVRPEIEVHAAPEAIALLDALAKGGDVLPGPRDFTAPPTAWVPTEAGAPVRVGPMTVRRFDLDHDVPGASGYLVTTGDGVLAFTGDIRFHGHHPGRSWASPREPRLASTGLIHRAPRRTSPATTPRRSRPRRT
jgi:ribonuclease J